MANGDRSYIETPSKKPAPIRGYEGTSAEAAKWNAQLSAHLAAHAMPDNRSYYSSRSEPTPVQPRPDETMTYPRWAGTRVVAHTVWVYPEFHDSPPPQESLPSVTVRTTAQSQPRVGESLAHNDGWW